MLYSHRQIYFNTGSHFQSLNYAVLRVMSFFYLQFKFWNMYLTNKAWCTSESAAVSCDRGGGKQLICDCWLQRAARQSSTSRSGSSELVSCDRVGLFMFVTHRWQVCCVCVTLDHSQGFCGLFPFRNVEWINLISSNVTNWFNKIVNYFSMLDFAVVVLKVDRYLVRYLNISCDRPMWKVNSVMNFTKSV